jgi:SAM-dependent methyltransferase
MQTMVDQIAFWNGPSGEIWVAEQASRDAMLAAYGAEAMRAASLAPGSSVLDVGCGCGTTTLAIGDLVGADGRVHGVDVSGPMIARAKELAKARPNVTFALEDATTAKLEAASFDLVFSRFGVMFFPEPERAFANLRHAMKPGARLAFVCWRALAENPWAKMPLDAAIAVVGKPEPPPPGAPGPFAFADASRVRAILEHAGFGSIEARAFDTRVEYAKTVDTAASRLVAMGPASRLLANHDEPTRAKVVAGARELFAPFVTPSGVQIPGATWIVTAARGA